MTAHANAETLSAYLDRELSPKKADRLEEHLEDCPRCQAHLESLTRVIGHLQRLEQTAPPPILAERVARRVTLERSRVARRGGMVERIERKLDRVPLQSSILSTFALVFALAAIAYLFAVTLEQIELKRIPVVVATPEELADQGTELPARLPGYVFDDGAWWQESIPREPAAGLPGDPVEPSSALGREILAAHPEVRRLLIDGAAVVVRHEGRVVRLQAAAPP
jgi:hypothetical protein